MVVDGLVGNLLVGPLRAIRIQALHSSSKRGSKVVKRNLEPASKVFESFPMWENFSALLDSLSEE